MTTELEDLITAGEDLIGQIEDAREAVDHQIIAISGSAHEIDDALFGLSKMAADLQERIARLRQEHRHQHDPVA